MIKYKALPGLQMSERGRCARERGRGEFSKSLKLDKRKPPSPDRGLIWWRPRVTKETEPTIIQRTEPS